MLAQAPFFQGGQTMEMHLPQSVRTVKERLEQAGFLAYLVGGCVRDFLMGVSPQDYDMATDARPDEVKACFADFTVVETGIRHGTVTVIADGQGVEITTFRTDGNYLDHRRPESVAFTSCLADDLARRDFTVNAMAFGRDGLQDPFGGREDLRRGRIVCVGDPERRFEEDGLRILRAMRFAATLGFAVEDGTARAVHAKAPLLDSISFERKLSELKKLICGQAAAQVLLEFADVMERLIPELSDGGTDWREGLRRMPMLPPRHEVRLAALLSSLSGEGAAAVLTRFKADTVTKRRVSASVAEQNAPLDSRSDTLRLIHRVGFASAADAAWLQNRPDVASAIRDIEKSGAPVSVRQLAVNGDDLMALGIRKGKAVGDGLEALLLQVMDGELPNDREALLSAAARL